MVIVPGEFIYVFSPRTASRALEQALLKIPGALTDGLHHSYPWRIPDLGLPVYATIRNPYDQVLSHWGNYCQKTSVTIEQFLDLRVIGRLWAPGSLNPYDEWVSEYFVYEAGMEAVMARLGHPEIEVPKVGVINPDRSVLTQSIHARIRKEFSKDLWLYREVTQEGIRRAA